MATLKWTQKLQGCWPSYHRTYKGYKIDICPTGRQYQVRIEGQELPFKWFTMVGLAKVAAVKWIDAKEA